MFEVKVSSDTINGLREDLGRLLGQLAGGPSSDAPPEAAQAPKPRAARKPKDEPKPETMSTAVPNTVAPALTAANAATTATAEALFGGVPESVPTPAPKATQKDLIAAFRALAEAKGTDPIVKLLAKYSAKSVTTIPEASWSAAIADAQLAAK